jgi:hypothetical protein
MVELGTDLKRQVAFRTASEEAALDDFNYEMHETMDERLNYIRSKQLKSKGRFRYAVISFLIMIMGVVINLSIHSNRDSMANTAVMSPQNMQQMQALVQQQLPEGVNINQVKGQLATMQLTPTSGFDENSNVVLAPDGKSATVKMKIGEHVIEQNMSLKELSMLRQMQAELQRQQAFQ